MDLNYISELIKKAEYDKAIDFVEKEQSVEAKYLFVYALVGLGRVDESINILNQNKALYEKNNYWKTVYYESMGRLVWLNGNLDDAMDYMLKAQSLLAKLDDQNKFDPLNNTMTLESIIVLMIGVIYDNKGDFNHALEYGLKALKLQKAENDVHGIVTSYLNIGYIYAVRGLFDQSMEYYEKGLNLIKENGLNTYYCSYYDNVASIYANKNMIDLALDYALKSLKIGEELKTTGQSLAFTYKQLIELYLAKGKSDEAELYLTKLEYYSKKYPTKRIDEIYLTGKAYFLKSSKRLPQKAEGEKLFRSILKAPYCRLGLRIWALKNLLELLLLEYRTTKELEVIDEINYFLHEIEEIATNQQIYKSMIDVSILKSRLATIIGDYNSSLHELEEAKKIAVENHMTYFIGLISKEKEKISKDFQELQNLASKNKELSEMLQNDEMMDYIVAGLKIIK